MTILNDKQITALCEGDDILTPMIMPFEPKSVRLVDNAETSSPAQRKVLSFGTSSFGYDVRLRRDQVQIFTNVNGGVLDPKRPNPQTMADAKVMVDEDGAEYFLLPPNSYALAATIEEFHIPRDVTVLCVGKSTYARMGVLCNTTPIEAGFIGNVVIELANGTSLPCKVYLEEGIAQFLFFQGSEECQVSYADRNGKYMHQGMHGRDAITHSKV